jgi:putative ABC transport system substrate-binding protein
MLLSRHTRRRDFIAGLGSAAAWPLAARAQQPNIPVIGYLGAASRDKLGFNPVAFRKGLSESGYVEGRNVAIEERWAEGQADRLPALAAALVSKQVAVIFAGSNAAAAAVKATKTTIPVVFATGGDPVDLGLVASLNRPGGTMTGVSFFSTAVVSLGIQMLLEAAPKSAIVAALVNPANPNTESDVIEAQRGTRTRGLPMRVFHASNTCEIDAAVATLARLPDVALYIQGDPLFASLQEQLAAVSLQHAVPALYNQREFVAAGGLISYGASKPDAERLAGSYVGRILKGDKPADLPVQQSVKVELFLNMKTAKALGLTFPTALLVRADDVIE